MSNTQVAKEFHVSTKTIEREIDWAKRQGLVATYEDQILNELVPEAIGAFRKALANGDAQVALEVLKGTGLLRKQSDKSMITPPPQVEEETLEVYTMKRKRVQGGTFNAQQRITGTNGARHALPAAGESGANDGSLSEDSYARPAAIEAELVETGDESRETNDLQRVDVSALAQGSQS